MGEEMKKTKEKVRCIHVGSLFYTLNQEYIVYKDANGVKYVKGSDGFYDRISNMVSKFSETI